MASGSIRITNIPISADSFDYTLGATATWSTTRSGNTVTVSGKVTTDEQGGYPFNSTYAINCTLVWGGDVKHNIVIKAADNGSSIFSRSQTYTKSFTVNSTQTSISMSVVINHTNNPTSGSGSGTITFPVGWTNISYTKVPKPVTTTYPWRASASTVKWYAYKGTDGISNTISKYTVYYNRYQKSASKWLGWTKQTEFSASSIGSNSYFTVSYGGSLSEGDAVKLKVIATGKMGDTAEVVESATWSTSLATQGFQTGNTAPPKPTFDTATPLTLGSTVNVKISAKDTTTAYYNDGQSHLNFSIMAGAGQTDWKSSSTGTYTNTFSYTKNVASLLTNYYGKTITLYAGVYDGFTQGTIATKTYQCGKNLIAGSLSLSSTTIPYSGSLLTIQASPVSIDNSAYHPGSSVTTTIKLYASYSSSSGFVQLASSTVSGNNGYIFTDGLTRTELIDTLGKPSSTSSKIYFKASYSISGFTTVYSAVKSASIAFINPTAPTMNWNSNLAYYRYNNGNPVGRCVASSVPISIVDSNASALKYIFTCGSVTKTVSPTQTSSTVSLSVSSLTTSKTYNVTYQIYEKATEVLLKSGTISDSTFYRAGQITAGPSHSWSWTDKNFLENETNVNSVTGTYEYNMTDNQVYKSTIQFYLNNTLFYTKNLTQLKKNTRDTSVTVKITITDSNAGYKPSAGYKITGVKWGSNNEETPISNPSITVNGTNTLKIVHTIQEQFAMSPSTNVSSYVENNSNFDTTLSNTLTDSSATAAALPVATQVKLFVLS